MRIRTGQPGRWASGWEGNKRSRSEVVSHCLSKTWKLNHSFQRAKSGAKPKEAVAEGRNEGPLGGGRVRAWRNSLFIARLQKADHKASNSENVF